MPVFPVIDKYFKVDPDSLASEMTNGFVKEAVGKLVMHEYESRELSLLQAIILKQKKIIDEIKPLVREFAEWEEANGSMCILVDYEYRDIAEIVSDWAMEHSFRAINDELNKGG